MYNSKLITLLKGLNRSELHWLQKFLKSPFYNNKKENILLFEYLKKYHPVFDTPQLDKEFVFKKLYPRAPYNVQKMRKAMYELATLIEEFMVAIQVRKSPIEQKQLLIQSLGERNIYQQFKKTTHETISQLEALPYRDADIFYKIHSLNYKLYDHIDTNRQSDNINTLEKLSSSLDCYYLSKRQHLDFAIQAYKKLLGNKIKIPSLQQSIRSLEQEPFYKIFNLISDANTSNWDDDQYLKIKTHFIGNIDKISAENKLAIIRILLNYLISNINKGGAGYQAKVLELYKLGLKESLFIENEQINGATFSNIVSVGLYEKEFDWVEQFIISYNKYLTESIRSDTTCLALGLLHYHKNEFSKTIDLILNHSFSKPLLILRSKTTLLRTYFEQYLKDNSYYDFLIAQTQAFEKFIRRNRYISDNKKESYLNFALIIRKITYQHNQKTLSKRLYNNIKSSKSVVLKFWLLQKLEEELN